MPEEVNALVSETAAVAPVAESIETGEAPTETASESATEETKQPTEQEKQEQESQQKHKGGFQRRIDKLSARLSASEEEKEYWRQQALRTSPKATASDEKEPKVEDFTTYEQFVDARIEFKARQLLKAQTEQTKAKTEQEQLRESWQGKLTSGRTKHEDFDEVVSNPVVPIPPHIAEAVMSDEQGDDVAYYLGSHPQEAARLARLSPVQAAREIGKISARFAQEATAAKKEPPPLSKAPSPVKPVARTTGARVVDLNDPNSDSREWHKEFRRKMGWEK